MLHFWRDDAEDAVGDFHIDIWKTPDRFGETNPPRRLFVAMIARGVLSRPHPVHVAASRLFHRRST
jgi:hypothetical protein